MKRLPKSPVVEMPKSPWISVVDQEPPIGEMILWYVRGRVMPGYRYINPVGGIENNALGGPLDFMDYGSHTKCMRKEFTHWRTLPVFG